MALCATTALAGAVSRLCVRGARGRFGGVRAGTWCCVSPVSPFPPRVFRAACGGPSPPDVPYPRLLVVCSNGRFTKGTWEVLLSPSAFRSF